MKKPEYKRAPKQLVCMDRIVPVKRRKRVEVEGEACRGSYSLEHGVEVERGPEEYETCKHEAGHFVFDVCELRKEWEERLGKDLAGQLEEQVMDKFLPMYRRTLKENGLE